MPRGRWKAKHPCPFISYFPTFFSHISSFFSFNFFPFLLFNFLMLSLSSFFQPSIFVDCWCVQSLIPFVCLFGSVSDHTTSFERLLVSKSLKETNFFSSICLLSASLEYGSQLWLLAISLTPALALVSGFNCFNNVEIWSMILCYEQSLDFGVYNPFPSSTCKFFSFPDLEMVILGSQWKPS